MTTIEPRALTVTIEFGDGRPRTGVVVAGSVRYPFTGLIGLLQLIEELCGEAAGPPIAPFADNATKGC